MTSLTHKEAEAVRILGHHVAIADGRESRDEMMEFKYWFNHYFREIDRDIPDVYTYSSAIRVLSPLDTDTKAMIIDILMHVAAADGIHHESSVNRLGVVIEDLMD